ncbi:MAG TPA: hypothetical protein VK634_15015 [Reyranella sp.]|nr:hypothetical protein [Reyranella sp.]HTE81995.1 hypothetical protein [Reyranella sp.]
MSLFERVQAIIGEHGETMTLARAGEDTAITFKGKRIGGALDGLGNTSQQRFRVKLSTAEMLASAWTVKEPSAGGTGPSDTLTVAGRVRNLLDVKPLRDGDTVAAWELEVAG